MMKRFTLALLALAASLPGFAQEAWPARPVTVVVPYTAGSQIDVLARSFSDQLQRAIGQPVVVLNRDGASATIGVEAVGQAKNDGYTLGFGPQGPFSIQPKLRKNLRYKAADFDFVCQANGGAFAVVVGPQSRFTSLADIVEAARKEPGRISFASGGHATAPHLIAESIGMEAGVKFNHIPFRNIGDMYTQILSGTVDFAVTTPAILATGKGARALAVVARQRLPQQPAVPLLRELNYSRSTMPGLVGLFAPKGIPAAASSALRKACPGIVQSAAFRQTSEKIDTPVEYADAPEYSAGIAQDVQFMSELITALGIQAE